MSDEELFEGRGVIAFERADDRRSFLRWAAIVGVGSALAVATRNRLAEASGDGGDVGILNYALTLEYLERDFFTGGLDAGLLSGRDLALVAPIRAHEDEHVDALGAAIKSLGGRPTDEPRFTYPGGTFGDKARFLRTAATLEDLAVKAYHGQVTRISRDLLGAAAAIAGTESRHAAILAELSGRNPFPAPLEVPESKAQVLRAARPFLRP
jgi:Ferritin-like domain